MALRGCYSLNGQKDRFLHDILKPLDWLRPSFKHIFSRFMAIVRTKINKKWWFFEKSETIKEYVRICKKHFEISAILLTYNIFD